MSQITNNQGLPDPVFKAIVASWQNYNKDELGDITTTELIAPYQLIALKRRYKDVIKEDVSDLLWSLEGSIIHMMFEMAAEDKSKVENRLSAQIEGWTLTGKYDFIEGSTLIDWKYTTVWSYIFGKPEWEQQSNVNRWLAHKNGIKIDNLTNWLMFKDWSESKVRGNYPPNKMMPVDLKVWPIEETEEWIRTRIKGHQAARDLSHSELKNKKPCSDEERWYNAKLRKFNRCERYCMVAPFCAQWRGHENNSHVVNRIDRHSQRSI